MSDRQENPSKVCTFDEEDKHYVAHHSYFSLSLFLHNQLTKFVYSFSLTNNKMPGSPYANHIVSSKLTSSTVVLNHPEGRSSSHPSWSQPFSSSSHHHLCPGSILGGSYTMHSFIASLKYDEVRMGFNYHLFCAHVKKDFFTFLSFLIEIVSGHFSG